MSTTFAVQTLIELAIAMLLVYGFMHEEKVISFEQNVKRIIKGNFKRFVRKCVKSYEEYKKNLDWNGEQCQSEVETQ